MLILHGGPGATHEAYEAFDSFLPQRAASTTTTSSDPRKAGDPGPGGGEEYDDPRYMELLVPYYEAHLLRRPMAEWPEPMLRCFGKLNKKVYVPMQGPSEMGASGVIEHWDRTEDLAKIKVPTLVIGARYDTMDPKWMEMMSHRFPRGDYLYLANGSHLAIYDDQQAYFAGLLGWLHKVDEKAQ